jgi:hypothetical protein
MPLPGKNGSERAKALKMLWIKGLKAPGVNKEMRSLPVDEAATGTMVLEAAAITVELVTVELVAVGIIVELAAAGTTVLEAAELGSAGATKTN